MNENLIIMDKNLYNFSTQLINKFSQCLDFQTNNSDYRVIRILLTVLKYEYDCSCDLEKYRAFIYDLLGIMAKNADANNFKYKIKNIDDIMVKLPYMSTRGIQSALISMASVIAMYEMVFDEYILFIEPQQQANKMNIEDEDNSDDDDDALY